MRSHSTRCAVLVTDRPLLPPWTGNRVRILGVIRALRALKWEVVLIAGSNAGPLDQLRSLVDGLVVVRARSFAGGRLDTFEPRPFRQAVERVVARIRPPVVIAEYAWLAPVLRRLPRGVHRWVDCHDLLHERTARFGAAGLDAWTICSREEEVGRLLNADVLIASQEREARVLRTLLPGKRVVSLLPEIQLPAGFPRASTESMTVLAVGGDHPGNAGIQAFAAAAWPLIRASVPQARLEVVGAIGAGMPDAAGLDAVGHVTDLAARYESAAVVICPVVVGTGIKIKMIEALRFGKAVVATAVAAEGLPRPTRPAWVAVDSPAASAEPVVRLLQDKAARAELEGAAFAFGERHLSAAPFRAQLESLLPNVFQRQMSRLLM
jgi:succinoglycan biosynthesis protein ExoO